MTKKKKKVSTRRGSAHADSQGRSAFMLGDSGFKIFIASLVPRVYICILLQPLPLS